MLLHCKMLLTHKSIYISEIYVFSSGLLILQFIYQLYIKQNIKLSSFFFTDELVQVQCPTFKIKQTILNIPYIDIYTSRKGAEVELKDHLHCLYTQTHTHLLVVPELSWIKSGVNVSYRNPHPKARCMKWHSE